MVVDPPVVGGAPRRGALPAIVGGGRGHDGQPTGADHDSVAAADRGRPPSRRCTTTGRPTRWSRNSTWPSAPTTTVAWWAAIAGSAAPSVKPGAEPITWSPGPIVTARPASGPAVHSKVTRAAPAGAGPNARGAGRPDAGSAGPDNPHLRARPDARCNQRSIRGDRAPVDLDRTAPAPRASASWWTWSTPSGRWRRNPAARPSLTRNGSGGRGASVDMPVMCPWRSADRQSIRGSVGPPPVCPLNDTRVAPKWANQAVFASVHRDFGAN